MKNKMFSQKGFSLIEVLIVLLIFTVIALAILRAYVSVVHVAGNSSAGAKSDSSVMFGLATADKILQGIGYGANSSVTSSYGTTLTAYDSSGTQVAVGTAGSSLVWKSDTSTCQALIISNKDNPLSTSSTATTHTGSGLFYYGAGYSCSSLALPASTSTETPTILVPVSDTNLAMASLKVITTTNCNPYSVSNSLNNGGAYAVILTANVYAGSGTTQNQVNNQTCLFNFR
ncbi:prepilin-type N-terminal cleavage/methylation domain-containing protein [Acinetobacter sp. ANC 4636]|uniref:prepilin-type N-terminal cleavage/methylation domain-containing protein n=1 Tax=Acinetobacter sp. ANC 4635 TaxID=2529846 RepID=UPI00103E1B79|nr:prepilin-type N-terminal cleavage/methylation domain-containing protein [Acinetobacter sp. ANC 4635]TCB32502.1 type II secretion system protein [Acinetobacter sp. ANC 4635]